MSENEGNLPQRQIKSKDKVESLIEQNKHFLTLQAFTAKLNKDVDKGKLQEHPIVKNVLYLPVGIMQMQMDELFLGQWKTSDFRHQTVINEIVGSEILHFLHPISNNWLCRVGVGAIQIMCDSFPESKPEDKNLLADYNSRKNQWAVNLTNKKPGALSNGGFGALEAYCFKNAALTIGKVFGRDVNRKFYDEFSPWVTSVDKKITDFRKKISDSLEVYQDTDKQEIIELIVKAEDEGTNTPDFYASILKRFGNAAE
jgi:hypothetical protein